MRLDIFLLCLYVANGSLIGHRRKTPMNSVSSTTRDTLPCEYCATDFIGGPDHFSQKTVHSQNVSQYANCSERTQCLTVITMPEGYYILFAFENLYLLPGDRLIVFDGDLSLDDIEDDEKEKLAKYDNDDNGGAAVESNSNQMTLLFEFRFYDRQSRQSFFIANYNPMKSDCMCHEPSVTQPTAVKFQSPNYPHDYCPHSQCEYFINISNQDANTYCAKKPVIGVTVSFSQFDLHLMDYLIIYENYGMKDEFPVARYAGGVKPASLFINSRNLKIIFYGINAGRHTGFKGTVKVECGHSMTSGEIDDPDKFHKTMGTVAAVGLCVVASIIVMIVILIAIKETKRWRRSRTRENGDAADEHEADLAISIAGPLPSYNDALRCMKWEPSGMMATVITNPNSRQTSIESSASFAPEAETAELIQQGPPVYEDHAFNRLTSSFIYGNGTQLLHANGGGTSDNAGYNNHGFNIETYTGSDSTQRVRQSNPNEEMIA